MIKGTQKQCPGPTSSGPDPSPSKAQIVGSSGKYKKVTQGMETKG